MSDTVQQALDALKVGKMVIVTDDADRENEGDFIILGEKTRQEDINFMMREGRGL
ncbi:MAG: 3,4-dihydroxy-2-butanone-4-phosphate synthase, partial [Candidatus Marinimicrobia bacterium]|nr:3,4-dihydroxy-2-butanone-4-phosphate synthase [Candidatus Neomarinimicrobiota bacterium]